MKLTILLFITIINFLAHGQREKKYYINLNADTTYYDKMTFFVLKTRKNEERMKFVVNDNVIIIPNDSIKTYSTPDSVYDRLTKNQEIWGETKEKTFKKRLLCYNEYIIYQTTFTGTTYTHSTMPAFPSQTSTTSVNIEEFYHKGKYVEIINPYTLKLIFQDHFSEFESVKAFLAKYDTKYRVKIGKYLKKYYSLEKKCLCD